VHDARAAVPRLQFSADTLAPPQRVSAWREDFGQRVLNLDIESLSAPGEFRANATLMRLPELGIIAGASSPVRFTRSRHLIDTDDVALSIAVSGESRFVTCGREYTLRVGDATLTGAGEGGMNEAYDDCRYVVLRMPRKIVMPSGRSVGDVIGRRIPAESGSLRLLRKYLSIFEDPATFTLPDMRRMATAHVHDLVTLTLGATRDATEAAGMRGRRAARLRAIKAEMLDNLSKDLSVEAIAGRHGVAVRYVQRLFEAEGTTFSGYALEQRLIRARQILLNPYMAHLKVATVATEVGFASISYFNLVFRRRYGISPSDLRAQARRSD
jgi:AraC-like DNA-binding protein